MANNISKVIIDNSKIVIRQWKDQRDRKYYTLHIRYGGVGSNIRAYLDSIGSITFGSSFCTEWKIKKYEDVKHAFLMVNMMLA